MVLFQSRHSKDLNADEAKITDLNFGLFNLCLLEAKKPSCSSLFYGDFVLLLDSFIIFAMIHKLNLSR